MRRGQSDLGPFLFRARPNQTVVPVQTKNQNGPLQSAGLGLVPAQFGETERGLKDNTCFDADLDLLLYDSFIDN
jgi:hypothetical protein